MQLQMLLMENSKQQLQVMQDIADAEESQSKVVLETEEEEKFTTFEKNGQSEDGIQSVRLSKDSMSIQQTQVGLVSTNIKTEGDY